MKKVIERELEKPARSKEEMERGKSIREGVITTYKERIAHLMQQYTFAVEAGNTAEANYYTEELKAEQVGLNKYTTGLF